MSYYDEIGNPTSYLGWSFDWQTLSYTYTPDGIRNSKTVNGTKTEYLLNGTQILAQKTGSDVMWFFYDSSGTRVGVQQGNVTAYYMYNLQGDVIGLADAATGKVIAKYLYDAWGKCISVENASGYTIGTDNPFRYRGYYYDNETGFYYLNSRYYDPEVGRFLNADAFVSTNISSVLSTNMFAYCENNPVNKFDPTGDFAISATLGGIALWKIGVAIVGAVATFVIADTLVKNPPTISIPKAEDKTKDIAPPKPRRDPTHHIVAKADPRAAESRKILRDVGIEPVIDPRNLVMLPQSYHASLHTNAYHSYVTERLRLVAGDKAGVEATLASLKVEILARSAAGIRWD